MLSVGRGGHRLFCMSDSGVTVVLRDAARGGWLRFDSLQRTLVAHRGEDVPAVVDAVESAVADGLYAAGFISYEAAPAFDSSLPAKEIGPFPLIWFGLFREVRELDSLPVAEEREGCARLQDLVWTPSITRQEYQGCLARAREWIREGDTYQVNFTYRLRSNTEMTPWNLFTQMAFEETAPYAAFIDTGDWAVCCASPELFFRREGEQIVSRPMKGTAPRGRWSDEDLGQADRLRSSEKERAENVMIVDMVRNDLGRVAEPGSVHVSSLYDVERYPTLWQLTSSVNARTTASWGSILRATFPPASITGAPKRRAMEIISELETTPRRGYTGSIGYLMPGGNAQFNVAIRTVLMDQSCGEIEYGTGGGIVWDSTEESEFDESLLKAKVLGQKRASYQLLETILWTPFSKYVLLDYHLKRLTDSAEYAGFEMRVDLVREELARAAVSFGSTAQRVRLTVTRSGVVTCSATELPAESRRFSDIGLSQCAVHSHDWHLYHKTTARNVYERALAASPGATDVLLFNEVGEITETTIANVAFEIDGELRTPPLKCGLLPGTYRAWLLDLGVLRECPVTIDEALACETAYLMNSVRGMQRVRIRGEGQGKGRGRAGEGQGKG